MCPASDDFYTIIETSRGLLFFSEDEQGRKLLHGYLQEMTDRYFDPGFELGPVRLYHAGYLPQGAESALDPSARPLESYDYLPADRLPEMFRDTMRLRYESDMAPAPAAFADFLAATHTRESQRNENIRTMLEGLEAHENTIIKQSLLPPSAQTRQQIAFAREDYTQLDQLLTKAYDIRGHRSLPLILDNPDWSVRVDGVDLNTYHRMVLRQGHCLYLPEQEKVRPDHTYAWIGPENRAILFDRFLPPGKRILKVKAEFCRVPKEEKRNLPQVKYKGPKL